MLLRRQLPLAAAAALALACAPSVPQTPPPASVTYAVFDPTHAQLPLPNDLAILSSSIANFPPSAQKDLLTAWALQGGFPNDQEVDITIDFQTQNIDPKTGAITAVPADIDLATVTADTVKIIQLPGASVPFAPITSANYVKSADLTHPFGTLTLKSAFDYTQTPAAALVGGPWAAGVHYAVAVRGGPNGVKTKDGVGINPTPTFFLLTRGVSLALPANQTLLPGTAEEKAAAGAQLEQLRLSYITPFVEVSNYFPSTDLAVMSTFQIAPNGSAYVQADPTRGLIPLPSDFLLDPATGGATVANQAAFGPLAGGLATLDGFSTTGMVLSTTSAPILGGTVTNKTVFVYDLSNPAAPVRVPDATEAGGVYQSEPSAIEQSISVGGHQVAVSTAIGLQPAIPTASGAMLPPLKENTEYAVLISNGVKDLNQAGLSRSTLAQLLLFAPDHPVAAGGKSLLQGVPDGQAAQVEAIRQKLHPAIAQLATDKNIPRSDLAMAYTFRTQSISGTGNFIDTISGVPAASRRPVGLIQLAALPYGSPALSQAMVVDPIFTSYTPAEAWSKYGIDAEAVPNNAIAEVIDAKITVPEILSSTTGAFDPALAGNPNLKQVKALIAVPKFANLQACPQAYGDTHGAKCAPLVVFHHGLGGSRSDMLPVANALVQQGFIVAAIDMAKHGSRSWCSADNQCALNADGSAGTCVAITGAAAQGDTKAPGVCSNGPATAPTLCASLGCLAAWEQWTVHHPTDPADGLSLTSSNYFVSANFFRTRDTIREDVIDQSALILALARPPTSAALPAVPSANLALYGHLASGGLIVDPAQVYWEGQSLGAILGTLNTAANPRISRAALNVGGGTLVDIITNAPAFAASIGGLLHSVGIDPATNPAGYLKFLILAKWILDPADPINAAGHILGDTKHPTYPDIFASEASGSLKLQAGKNVVGQMAACDATVPNPFNLLLYGDIGILDMTKFLNPSDPKGNVTLFEDVASAGSCAFGPATLGALPHGFITNWGINMCTETSCGGSPNAPSFSQDENIATLTGIAQQEAAAFLFNPTNLPPSVVAAPLP